MRRTLPILGLLAVLSGASPALATTPGPNGAIIYGAEFGTDYQLFVVSEDGSAIRQVTNEAGRAHVHPDWGPRGGRIAYELGAPEDAHIAIATPNGKRLRTVKAPGFLSQPAFTPDGSHVLFSWFRGEGDQGVWIMRPDGSGKRRLTQNPFPGGGDDDPNISPNGRVVTFVRIQEESRLQALFAVDIDGTNLRQLTPYTFDVAIKHDWAPDGSRIVLTTNANFSHPGESANMVTIRPDGSDLRPLTQFSGGNRNAFVGSYSPDGRWIVFRLEQDGAFALAKIRPDGTGQQVIRELPVRPRYIDWGPART